VGVLDDGAEWATDFGHKKTDSVAGHFSHTKEAAK
jgi:hypothetical protein